MSVATGTSKIDIRYESTKQYENESVKREHGDDDMNTAVEAKYE